MTFNFKYGLYTYAMSISTIKTNIHEEYYKTGSLYFCIEKTENGSIAKYYREDGSSSHLSQIYKNEGLVIDTYYSDKEEITYKEYSHSYTDYIYRYDDYRNGKLFKVTYMYETDPELHFVKKVELYTRDEVVYKETYLRPDGYPFTEYSLSHKGSFGSVEKVIITHRDIVETSTVALDQSADVVCVNKGKVMSRYHVAPNGDRSDVVEF